MNVNTAIAELAKLGVPKPWDSGPGAIQAVLDAYLRSKSLDRETVLKFLQLANPPAPALYAALQAVVAEQSGLSRRVVEVIETGITTLKETLGPDASAADRAGVRAQVVKLIEMAREESERDRRFKAGVVRTITCVAAPGALIVASVIVFKFSPQTSRALFQRGILLFKAGLV